MNNSPLKSNAPTPIKITLYKWAGKFGPFKVTIPCGECTLTTDIIKDVLPNELNGIAVELITLDWLSHWWQPLFKGGWHAPIVMIENKIISQGVALNRGVLTEALIQAYANRNKIIGNHLFGKEGCTFCQKAKALLTEKSIQFTYHDVIKQPAALYEMLARVKPLISAKTPVTVPQIWMNGEYIGGYDNLAKII